MKANLEDFLADVQNRREELTSALSSPEISVSDRNRFQRELSHLSGIAEQCGKVSAIEESIREAKGQLREHEGEEDIVELFAEELKDLKLSLKNEEEALEDLMYPPDESDRQSAFLEIRAGTGGQEAALFASDLNRMYANYAAKRGWRVAVVSAGLTDIGGIREVVLHVQGKGVYGTFKHESGVHRVQRVPKTEASGRIHTSTATVAILPEVDETEIQISPADLRIDVFRASGAGGQHVNKTDSAVRITHIPTGVVVSCQDERSQHKNKAKAMKVLQSRLVAAQREKLDAEASQKRKQLIGGGMRSEKIRTYNFPQNRVTDHRIGLTLKKLDLVLEGDLDEIFEALSSEEKRLRRAEAFKLDHS